MNEIINVEDLWHGCVDAKPVDIDDWAKAFIEEDRANFWDIEDTEATNLDDEPIEVVVDQSTVIAVVVDGEAYEKWDDYVDTLDVDEDGEPVGARLTEDAFEKAMEADVYPEGPMIDVWYPVPIGNPVDAATTLRELPLCVVEVDGDTGIALTGAGMDLSWQICEAYVRLGYLPPVHFSLPSMAMTWTTTLQLIADAMKRSLHAQIESAEHGLRRLATTVEFMKERGQ